MIQINIIGNKKNVYRWLQFRYNITVLFFIVELSAIEQSTFQNTRNVNKIR